MGSVPNQRPVRIANCSGAVPDPGHHMYNQAKEGPVDVITGDYLAEVNLGNDAEAMASGTHPGWIHTAWQGLQMSIDLINEKRIKVIINGGSLNPKGLAEKTHELVTSKNLDLVVAYVEGDDYMHKIKDILKRDRAAVPHLDDTNTNIKLAKDTLSFLDEPDKMPIVSANAYLGMRAIKKGLQAGADIIICGRVADASPVIGAAAWWHDWPDNNYDALAGALVAGHIIECSTYATGANFSGFTRYSVPALLNLGLPICEISSDGTSVITKHASLPGFVTPDIVKCQFLYELQGTTYLNSDVKADLTDIRIEPEDPSHPTNNRVLITGIKGQPPPPTTKLAIFYKAGYQAEILINACGLHTAQKFSLQEAQLRDKLQSMDLLSHFDVLDFQRIGTPEPNPRSQNAATSYLRIFAQARERDVVAKLMLAWGENAMQHFAGMHSSMDFRNAVPKPFLGFYPGVVRQGVEVEESVSLIGREGKGEGKRLVVGPPARTEEIGKRESYDTKGPVDLGNFGEMAEAPLGNVALGRSGDKGGNVNAGFFVQTEEEWEWLRTVMTKDQLKRMMGEDWEDWFFIERCEMPKIRAVHFVVYGVLGRGITSTKRLDGLGKGFAEFIGAVHLPVPTKFFEAVKPSRDGESQEQNSQRSREDLME